MRVPSLFFAVACAAAAQSASAEFGVIDDKSFFDGIEHTFLDFETKGDGSPVDLPLLGRQKFDNSEYIDYGVNFVKNDPFSDNTKLSWLNFELSPLRPDSQSLDAVGSAPTAIGGGNDWTITFSVPVHAVGIGVVQGGWGTPSNFDPPEKVLQTRMRAFDAGGTLLGEVFFWGDLVDGGFGPPFAGGFFGEEFDQYPFGFLGIFSPDTPFAKVQFTHGVDVGVIFDDLHFSALPAPGPGAALILSALGAGLCRRR